MRRFSLPSIVIAVAILLITLLIGSWSALLAHANPVERIVARCRVLADGRNAIFRAGGTIDSVEYFAGAGAVARKDSAQFCVAIDGITEQPPESTAANGMPWGSPALDSLGNGAYEWAGRVTAFGTYRKVFVPAPFDTFRVGEGQPALFDDDGAFVRVAYQAAAVVSITALGSETLRLVDADSFAVDQGSCMVPSAVDTTQLFFTGGGREGGLRYVVRTRAVWTAGTDRWLRLEVSRDTTALGSPLW